MKKSCKNSAYERRNRAKEQLSESLKLRLAKSDDFQLKLKIQSKDVAEIVQQIEMEMHKSITDVKKYTSKLRTLVYNIRNLQNNYFFKNILQKTYDAKYLITMSTDEMASPELMKWRENENKMTLKVIEEAQVEAERNAKFFTPIKFTHKGEIYLKDENMTDLYYPTS